MNREPPASPSANTSVKAWRSRLITIMALVSLVVAWCIGYSQVEGLESSLSRHFNATAVTVQQDRNHSYLVDTAGSSKKIYAAMDNGYGGPLSMAFTLDKYNKIRSVDLVSHVDTPGYVANVLNRRFLDRLEGKVITSPFTIGQDIDGISGATLTIVGMTNAVRKAAHEEALAQSLTIKAAETGSPVKVSDLALVVLILLVLFERHLPSSIRKYHILIVGLLSVVVIGYWANVSLSIASLSSLMLGYWPDPDQNLAFYLVLSAVAFGIFWKGKNLYCSQLCPFHHIQRWLNKLGQNNLPVANWVRSYSINIINTLLWLALMLIFLSRNPALGSYEPFSMLFSLDGIGIQWYILPLALTGSFFIKDYWCRLLCPLGRGLNLMVRQQQQVKRLIRTKAL
ncbi:FMN-binding protein [Endozoicomonas sp.]|uniref:FMN-binding protein n=1 Tax=Endozoicomonas sp. TaxID=1892382 RepID=UPI003AF9D1C0